MNVIESCSTLMRSTGAFGSWFATSEEHRPTIRRSALAREPTRFVTIVFQIRHYVAARRHV